MRYAGGLLDVIRVWIVSLELIVLAPVIDFSLISNYYNIS